MAIDKEQLSATLEDDDWGDEELSFGDGGCDPHYLAFMTSLNGKTGIKISNEFMLILEQ